MADQENSEGGGLRRATTVRRQNKTTSGSSGESAQKRGQKVQNNQTLADFWNSNPNKYYFRQSLVLAGEIAFLVCASFYMVDEKEQKCFI